MTYHALARADPEVGVNEPGGLGVSICLGSVGGCFLQNAALFCVFSITYSPDSVPTFGSWGRGIALPQGLGGSGPPPVNLG